MSQLFTRHFALDALERSVKAFAGGLIAGFGSDAINLNVFQASALTVLERAGSLAVISIALSILSAPARGISPASVVPPGA